MENPPEGGVAGSQVLFEEVDYDRRRFRPLPALSPADAATLATFLESAHSNPGRWHRLPESDLAFRVAPDDERPNTFCFELRDDRFPDEPQTYHYDHDRLVLSCTTDYAIELCDLPDDHRLPRNSEAFALAAISVLDPYPNEKHK